MKTILYAILIVLIILAFTQGLRWCYNGPIWMIPGGCHEFRLEVMQK